MKRPYLFFSLLLLCGCLSPRYSSLINPTADFSVYKTFYCSDCLETMDRTRPRYDNEHNRRLIRDAIQKELEDRGYIFQEYDTDMLVEFDFIIQDHIDTVAQRTTSYRYWRGFETDTYNYKVGTLIINIIDNYQDVVVWQGTAESFLDLEPEKVEENIPKVVKKILQNYPYKAEQ